MIKVIDQAAQEKGDQHNRNNDKNILIDRAAFLLDCLNRHITNQIDRPAIHRPHIIQGIFISDIMIKHDILVLFQACLHFLAKPFLLNGVGPIKICQIQMPRAPLPHSLRLQDKTFRFRIHNIEHCFFVVKSLRKRPVKGIINVLYIKRPNLLFTFHNRTLNAVSPCSHIVQIRLRYRQSVDCSPGRKIQFFLCKHFSRAGYALAFSGSYQRDFHHCFTFLILANVILRLLHCGNSLCHEPLILCFLVQYRFNRAFY